MQSALFGNAYRLVIGLAIIFFLLLSAACNNAPAPVVVNKTETPSGKLPPRTTLPMPPITTTSDSVKAQSFTLMNDQRAKLSDYLGKVVVLDFWATYCPPCRAEAPHLDALQKRFSNKGLLVIGLNVGGPDDRPLIPNFTEGLKLKYTMGFPDPEMTYLFMGNDDTIPQTLVFDRRGRVLKHFVGYDQAVSTELERTVQEALEEKD
ncbi:MAG: TlpA family protein disulfide reductase [Chloroflexi bacterium]|nr:MAG: TlpA family protein disulfide reductase [Chloroflexota bacterium]